MVPQTPATFFCIYSGQNLPVDQRNLEHIVPYSLGGPGTFGTSDVSAKANSDIGSLVDMPLINHPCITFHRWRLKLKSENGNIPGINFPGTVEVNGRKMEVTYTIHPDGTVKLTTHPEVTPDWTTGSIRVACDPKDLPGILENIGKRAVKKGIADGPADIKVEASMETRLERPEIHTERIIGAFDMTPGFAKMALGTGHFVFGETWSRSPDAALLRSFINEKNAAKRRALHVHGRVWPNGLLYDPMRSSMFIGNDHHVIVVLNVKPVAFYALLFGTFDGFVSLSQNIWTGPELLKSAGVVFAIDCKTRSVTRFDYQDFVAKRMTDKVMLSQ